ncbi:MAG: DUF1156 domain-containing protein [Candidatus Poribacteria bacterium]|nr:DUF1156 domain-containing protein [Candidatus Poribacteria bacterium]
MTNDKRLIEVAFPLKEVSLDSVHEKNVRHGHISTLHIWPARRPLAAARAALIATLLPDPGNADERKTILKRMAGKVVEKTERKRLNGRIVEKTKEVTEGGILHWGRENGEALQWFRDEIRKAYGGRAPKVLDPFAGGGAIPLEAMRLGCEVTAMDINPVAWFILKCTLEYPQKLAGQTRALPEFAVADREFMTSYLKAKGYKSGRLRTALQRLGHGDGNETQLEHLPHDDSLLKANLAWHVRAWGKWVLDKARAELAAYYPTYAEFEPIDPDADFEPAPPQLLAVDKNGVPQIDLLNAAFDDDYLNDVRNPRWIAKPTVAYLWARTVTCKGCRATLPLLKTRWLCKKERKRILLIMEPNADETGVVFGVLTDVPQNGGNSAQRREHDKRIGAGTMSRTGATCPRPRCKAIMTMEDIRLEGRAGRLGAMMTVVVVEGQNGKEYRLPTDHERAVAEVTEEQLGALYADIPFGLPEEPTPKAGIGASRAFSVDGYGFDSWRKLFTNRQLVCLGQFVSKIREADFAVHQHCDNQYWRQAILGILSCGFDRMLDFNSTILSWITSVEAIGHVFVRYALPMTWDYSEAVPYNDVRGGWMMCIAAVCKALETAANATNDHAPVPRVKVGSASSAKHSDTFDIIITDPPYYDAIPYSDLMDYFYVWNRRTIGNTNNGFADVFSKSTGPKWNHDVSDGELIDDAGRFNGDCAVSKENYERGMAESFRRCWEHLSETGRLVIVFANKRPQAWETLVGAVIRSGFVVDGSWPVQTEQSARMRAQTSAALASSIWIVCKKRPPARPGWDHTVLDEMRSNITQQLHDFWDAGIRGPDFVWAATGPALEAYSKYPVVKKATADGDLMSVSEFLREVRRMVVDFVVHRVLPHDGEAEATTELDDVTTYYLLHRNDFKMKDAPVGACILYALSCNLSDTALVNQHDLLTQSGARNADETPESEDDEEAESGSGAKVKLKPWHRRGRRNLGLEAPSGQPVPLIDQVHKLMHLWRAGDQVKVDNYLSDQGLQRNTLFNQILQALIELADEGSDERSILEALSNHVAAQGQVQESGQRLLF